MSSTPHGIAHVRLAAGPGQPPYVEFQLSEADLAWRIDPAAFGRRDGTIAHQAVETAWTLTHVAAEQGSVEDWGLPAEYTSQVAAFQKTGRPGMTTGELAEVTRASGARSVWRCTREDWVLLERQSAAMAARAGVAAADREAIAEHEADR